MTSQLLSLIFVFLIIHDQLGENQGMLIPSATLPPVPGSQKWTAVRSQNGTASLQDFIVSVDAATPAYAKLTAPAGVAPPAAAPVPAAAAGAAAVPPATASLLVYALGRLSGSLPPVEIANMDLRQLALFLCLDMGQNDTSSRRQMSADVLKTPRQIASEQPLFITAVSSLSGVGSLLTHAWSTPINAQNRFLRLFMQKFAVSAGAAPTDAAARTLLSAVAAAGYSPAPPTSTATKSAAPKNRKASAKSTLRSESADEFGGEDDALDGGVSVAESVDTRTASVAGSAAGAVAGPAAYPIKKWIRLARVVYGVPYVTYSDA